MKDVKKKGVSRRSVLKGSAAAVAGLAAGSGAITGFPMVWAKTDITLRQFGTGVSNLNAIAEKCKEDLGITLEMTAMDTDAAAQRAATQPDSYDIADVEYITCKKVFPIGVLQPMDTKKLTYYDKIVPLFITGKLTPDSKIAQGTAPHTVGFVEAAEFDHLRQRADRVDDDGSDHLQRRYAGRTPGPRRSRRSPTGATCSTPSSRARRRSSTSRRSASWTPR